MIKILLVFTTLIATSAQASDFKTGGGHCFRGKPDCDYFTLLEMGILGEVLSSNLRAGEEGAMITGEFGMMKNNRHKKIAYGAGMGFIAYDDGGRFFLKPRFRKWLGNGLAFDFSAGLAFGNNDNYERKNKPGLIAGISFTVKDYLSLDMLYLLNKYDQTIYYYDSFGPTTSFIESHTASSVYFGASGRSYFVWVPPVIITILFVITFDEFDFKLN